MRAFRLLLFYGFALILAYLLLLLVFALGEPGYPIFIRSAMLLGMICIFIVNDIIIVPGLKWGRWGYFLLAFLLFTGACVNYLPGIMLRESFFYGVGYTFAERVPRAMSFISFVPAIYFFYAGIRREDSSEFSEAVVKTGTAIAGVVIAACAVTYVATGIIIPVTVLLFLALYVLLTRYDRNIMRIALALSLGCFLYAGMSEVLLHVGGNMNWLTRLLMEYRDLCLAPMHVLQAGIMTLWKTGLKSYF